MDAVELKPDVYWVGAIDWAIRDFHGYVTPRGSTYNNYLILDDEVTLLDSVKHDFVDVSIARIRNLTDIGAIKHIVINHIEPDHASGLGEIMRLVPSAPIYCTQKGKDGLERFFDVSSWDIRVVKTGDELKIGKRTLLFIETPMIHWPDSMMTYIREDRILISQDGFGQHLASTQRFDDEFIECSSSAELEDSVWDYYANILMPFGTIIKRKIEEILGMGLQIDMIAPDHGVVWRQGPKRVLDAYLDMATGKCDERVVIIYDTMWHNTEKLTLPLMEGVRSTGMDCRVLKLRATPTSVAVKEFWRARGCLIGTPTLNNNIFPKIAEMLVYLKGLRPRDRMLSAFGSYGWAGGAVKQVLEMAREMKLQTVEPGFQFKYHASADEEEKCHEFGRDFALKVREYHKGF
jgi:anaerobic nitric oxide reductase flavorubredoxin